MKRIIFSSALLILLIGVTSLAPAEKHKYTSDEAKLSVTFPSEFSATEEVKDSYTSTKIQAISEDMIFLLICTKHDGNVAEEDGLTEVSLQSFMDAMGSESTNSSTWKVKKHSGVKSMYSVPDKDLIGDYRVVLIGNFQFQITVVSPKEAWDEKKAKKFFKSFKVKK